MTSAENAMTATDIEITNRHTGKVICAGETVVTACETHRASLVEANLRSADLRGADLSMANLRSADLRGADLREADLRGANLRGADLRGADLYLADLRGADLLGMNLHGANLREANLDGARLAWHSRDLIAEMLRRAAGGDVEKLKVAGLILVARGMCWNDFLSLQDPMAGWALSVLREYVVPGDDAPDGLRGSCMVELQCGHSRAGYMPYHA